MHLQTLPTYALALYPKLAEFSDFYLAGGTALVNNSSEFTVILDSTKFTFLHHPFPVVQPFVTDGSLHLLGAEEIAATKAYTIGRRVSFKDYVDIYFCLAKQVTNLNTIVSLASQKYGSEFNARLFLEQLQSPDAFPDEDSLQFLESKVEKEQLINFLKNEVEKFTL